MLWLLDSLGFKRYIASMLTALASVMLTIPTLASSASVIQSAAAAIGAVGLAHAFRAKTLATGLLASLTSVISILVVAADTVPQLAPYRAVILLLAAVLGISTTARGIQKPTHKAA